MIITKKRYPAADGAARHRRGLALPFLDSMVPAFAAARAAAASRFAASASSTCRTG